MDKDKVRVHVTVVYEYEIDPKHYSDAGGSPEEAVKLERQYLERYGDYFQILVTDRTPVSLTLVVIESGEGRKEQ